MDLVLIKNLRLKYPGTSSVHFKGLDLRVRKGEKILILGPSGCGKSTLLQVMAGIIPQFVEVPLKADRIQIPERWGYVFQDPDLQFCMPYVDEELAFVLENLQTPRHRMHAYIREYLSRVGLELDDIHLPISALSQGMKQRLAVACALGLEPDVLFLDEPTALLDVEGTKQVWNTIKGTCREKTVVIVEHKVDEVLDFIERIVVLNQDGEIVMDGLKDDVLKNARPLLDEYGIWYPGVWEEASRKGVVPRRGDSRPLIQEREPFITLKHFRGYRPGSKAPKIEVDRAEVYPGEWIAVVGANGAGKSSLLLALMGLLPSEGEYMLSGRPAGKTKDVAEHLAFVFQNPEHQFVTESVYDELEYSFKVKNMERSEREIERLLNHYGLAKQRFQHPFQLSTGQKRRLSVATAAVSRPLALLLDEPTFGQDAHHTFAILKHLQERRNQGAAVVMVTHDPEIVGRYANKIWVVERGILREERAG